MRPYRCYFVDAHGLIKDTRMVLCEGDREVDAVASGLLAERPQLSGVEIWNRCRKVGFRSADPQHA
jgi:hypothetical protein